MIPFSGTILPQSTFELPTNWGASSWTASVTVDIASVVLLATKAELAVDNTLDTGCAGGNTWCCTAAVLVGAATTRRRRPE